MPEDLSQKVAELVKQTEERIKRRLEEVDKKQIVYITKLTQETKKATSDFQNYKEKVDIEI